MKKIILILGGVAVVAVVIFLVASNGSASKGEELKTVAIKKGNIVDKALAIKDKCPKLRQVIWDDPKGLRRYDDPILTSLDQVMECGREIDRKEPHRFDELVKMGNLQRAKAQTGIKEKESAPLSAKPEQLLIVIAGGDQSGHAFWMAALMATMRSFCAMINGSLA